MESLDTFAPEASLRLPAPTEQELPQRVLYATSSGFGGTGLDSTSLEGARAAHRSGRLARVICYEVNCPDQPRPPITSLQWHPVRALSFLDSGDYYGAKKRYLDWYAERHLRSHTGYDLVHGWSGDCFRTLVEARRQRIPSVIDIPTWHRNKGNEKRSETKTEREARLAPKHWQDWPSKLPIERARAIAEYDLADVILVPSRKCAETFLAADVPLQKLHYVGRGVDAERYRPGTMPERLRFIFAGALIERKGVHHLLRAWKKLGLRDAELVLVGSLHDEIKPVLADCAADNVRHLGFSQSLQDELRASSCFIFPSECEGFAKVTIEAAACGLPLITTSESGDACVDGDNGWIIPPNDPDAICAALEHAAKHRDVLPEMGGRSRERVLRCLTWDLYRQRVLAGYAKARQRAKAR